ncbi:unnamed protein product [Rhizoctonia solani]|uniref:Fungal-type protein kinase domain-containing protein n=1 Tax=Rhizoctonia solani TaxID=456999 RepID=A0A8H3C515_9AGAM|nr:unnamed protein product [Rhizoctonia solani]
MSISYPPSSLIRKGSHPVQARTAAQTYGDLRKQNLPQDLAGEEFLQKCLAGGSLNPPTWSPDERKYVSQIQAVEPRQEESLYTDDAPLLHLLNSISKQAFQSINLNDAEQEALVFYSAHDCEVHNPFNKQDCKPDIVALWENAREFPEIDYSENHLTPTTWCALAAAGEVKISKSDDGRYQLANYLQNHLQLHPELNAVLGLTVRPDEYALFYHDAEVINRSRFRWEQHGPLYAFVEKLYTRPFQDTSMQIVGAQSQHPAWVTKINNDVYISEAPQAVAGPGQRRYTTTALNVLSSEVVFLKDIWRDNGRLFFEALLFDQAHKEEPLPGLMCVDTHGYVLDQTREGVRTISNQPRSGVGQASGRYKMRMLTRDIGRPLDTVDSLLQFLCVMYDACVVQRNLYRKCRILHRDISDGNIMIAPETDGYRTRCARGYAEVKFVNQVLAKDKDCKPAPACLVIDLGNGADLKVARDALKERTGTPRFIARSVSSGVLLHKGEFESMPSIKELGDYGQYMHPRQGSQPETDPHPDYCQFFHTMLRHFPTPRYDSRSRLCERSEEYWEAVLHPDLKDLSRMLKEMFEYIRPEWAYQPKFDPEHVHEALMRLLLAEIIRIKDRGEDIPLAIGGRVTPPLPPDMTLMGGMNSLSIQASTSLSRPPISLEPQRNNPTGAKPDKAGPTNPADSRLAETRTPGPSQQNPGELSAHDKLRARGKSLVWPPGAGGLRAPELQVPESPVLEQDVPTEDS